MTRNRLRSQVRVSPAPAWLVVLASLGVLYLVVPLVLMGTRVPWSDLPTIMSSEASVDALSLSLRACLYAIAIDLVLGIPLAVLLSRQWRGVKVARVLVALPLSLPPVVAGLALLSAFGRKGVIGGALESVGIEIAFSTTAVIMAQVFVSLPFLVITIESALRARPSGMEETAASLGAGPTRVLTRITLPMVIPGVARGSALALARCLGEFGATLTFAGSLQGVTRTLPLEIYLARESDSDTALALGMLLIVVAALVVALTEFPGHRRHTHTDDDETAPPEALRSSEIAPSLSEPAPVVVAGSLAARHWDVNLSVTGGQVIAVMGHNGAGKSTLAELIAGHLSLDEGKISIDNVVVDGPSTFVPARRRSVAALGQNPRIFGHMSVIDNVAFPLRCRGYSRRRAHSAAMAQLAAVGCIELARRRGNQLSGGQASKIGLARALSFQPRVLILDEPTAALDVEASANVARILAARLAVESTTTLVITHDIVEAVELADTLVVMDEGRIVEQGPPPQLLSDPKTEFTACLAGLNICPGIVEFDADGLAGVRIGHTLLKGVRDTDTESYEAGSAAVAAFPPEAVALYRESPSGSPRSQLIGVVQSASAHNGILDVRIKLEADIPITSRITTAAWAGLALAPGDEVTCVIKATQVMLIHSRSAS